MITRPLELLSKLQRPPAGVHFVSYLNTGLIALFFTLFGSRFVLSPGLGVDFTVPVMPDAIAGAVSTDVVVAIRGVDMAFVDGARVNFTALRRHLNERNGNRKGLRLLVQANSSLPMGYLTEIYDMAREAGFSTVQIAAEPVR